jgi:hypothetical protein
MTTVKLKYTTNKRGRLFWEPTPAMRAKGFAPRALGAADDPEAIAEALRLYSAWLAQKQENQRPTKYPSGTFGAFWDRFRTTRKWAKKGLRTREGYERAWRHMDAWRPAPDKPTLARTTINHITTDDCEAFSDWLEANYSASERHRTMSCFKALLSDAVVRLGLNFASPAMKVANPMPPGRTAFWLGAEIEHMASVAKAKGKEGVSLAIRLAWETMFSPIDIWTLQIPQLRRDATGYYVETERTKTGREAFAAISPGLAVDLLAYIGERRVGPVIVMRGGQPYRNRRQFNKGFSTVRRWAFGKDETRQCMDIRRSANVEADAAGADKATMAQLMANRLDQSKFLEETYTPPTVAKAREVARMRVDGRQKLAHELMRSRSNSNAK